METIGKIRRRHHVGKESISAIARSLNLSRNTVKKYLNAQAEPAYQRSDQPRPQLGSHVEQLDQWLIFDAALPKAQRRSARRLFEGLQAEGYAGAYDSVQRHVKAWKAATSGRVRSRRPLCLCHLPPVRWVNSIGVMSMWCSVG